MAGELVEHYNARVLFILAAVTVAASALVLTTVHSALTAADAEEARPGPSHERIDAEEAAFEVPGSSEEAVIADQALREERARNKPEPAVRPGPREMATGVEVSCDEPTTLVVGVDGSDTATRALYCALGLARRQHCSVIAVYAMTTPPATTARWAPPRIRPASSWPRN